MTARFSVKNNHIEYDLILVLKKQTPTVKVITVRLKICERVEMCIAVTYMAVKLVTVVDLGIHKDVKCLAKIDQSGSFTGSK
jgi:hypothetical protein